MRAQTRARTAGLLALTLAMALIAGCGGGMDSSPAEEYRGDVAASAPAPGAPDSMEGGYGETPATDSAKGDVANVAEADRMVIRSKTVRLEVESTNDAVATIRTIARDRDAVITQLQVATDTEGPIYRYDEYGYSVGDGAALRGWVTVRVPAASFDQFIDDVIALGTVRFQSEDTEDVTQQYIDLSARLENLRVEEQRLREFFDAAKNVEEMLAIEAELSRVRGEIESMDAQVKYLERQAAMATVTIELTEPRPVVRPDGESWGFREAVTSGFRGAAEVINFGIALIIATAPLWLLGLAAFFIVRAIVRRRRKTHQPSAAQVAHEQAGPEA